jgi:hypothetical protein
MSAPDYWLSIDRWTARPGCGARRPDSLNALAAALPLVDAIGISKSSNPQILKSSNPYILTGRQPRQGNRERRHGNQSQSSHVVLRDEKA